MPSPHLPLMQTLFEYYDRVSLEAQQALRAQGGLGVEAKADGSAVTRLDREVSRHVVDTLRRHTPDFGIISEEEEQPYRPDAEWQWVLDPLDGTASFARGYPSWGLGIGLLQGDQPREGYLRFPALNETFIAAGGRRTLNGQALPAAPAAPLPDIRNVLTGSPLHGVLRYDRLADIKLRNFGTNLYHLVCLAAGRAEAALCPASYLWDLAAALPFTRAVGMVERYVDGTPFSLAELITDRSLKYRMRQPMLVGPEAEVQTLLARLQG